MSLLDIQRLARSIDESDPRDAERQAQIHEHIIRLRDELDRAFASDLAAYLDSAAHLTNYLVHMGRMGPEDVLEIVGRLIRKVEESFEFDAEQENVEDAHPVVDVDEVQAPTPAPSAGISEERMLGEIMVQLGYVTEFQLEKGLVTQRATDQRIGEALVSIGAATWDQVREAVSVQKRLRSAIPLDIPKLAD
jgi:hypothetical protein